MNRAIYEEAKYAYENNDFEKALDLYNNCANDINFPLEPGEFGLVFHQIGNCLIKLNKFVDAINAYSSSASDSSYSSVGTVYYNTGMAYLYLNDFTNSIKNFDTAINTPSYKSKYKAYTAMGNALMKSGKPAEAGSVFRKAALDDTNPDPTRALLNLGVCFMALGRSNDAITVYESAFQFSMSQDMQNRFHSNLGQAYVASGQMAKAVNSFENARRDKTYVLSDSASVDYQRAIAAVSKGKNSVDMQNIGKNAAIASGMAVNTEIDNSIDSVNENNDFEKNKTQDLKSVNLDNLNNSKVENVSTDSFVYPDNNINNDNIVKNSFNTKDEFLKWQEEMNMASKPVKRKSIGKTILTIFLIIIALAIAAAAGLYALGFGYPTQEMVAKEYFANPSMADENIFASNITKTKLNSYKAMVVPDTNAEIIGVNRKINESFVYISSHTASNDKINYKIKMVRDVLGWKIQNVDFAFSSYDN